MIGREMAHNPGLGALALLVALAITLTLHTQLLLVRTLVAVKDVKYGQDIPRYVHETGTELPPKIVAFKFVKNKDFCQHEKEPGRVRHQEEHELVRNRFALSSYVLFQESLHGISQIKQGDEVHNRKQQVYRAHHDQLDLCLVLFTLKLNSDHSGGEYDGSEHC